MSHCIVCEVYNCDTPHSYEDIHAFSFKGCYVCRKPNCAIQHTIEELKNPKSLSPEEFRDALRISIAFTKLCEREEVEFRKKHG